jgi:ligand-binding sensor domain-containing protein/AraC-like DNA-binding protein
MVGILLLAVLQAAGMPSLHNFRSLSVSDGLSDLVVNACYKDRQGFVWFGTNVSLERFDGVRLKHYLIKGKSENLKRVYAIAETQGNELWVGADVGLLRLDRASDQLVAIDPTQIDTPVYCLLSDGKETLYIGTRKGLFIYQAGKLEHLLPDKNVFSQWNEVRGLNQDANGRLWMTTSKGVVRVELANKKVETYPYRSPLYSVTSVGDTLYAGTMNEGIVAFDMRTAEFRNYVDVGCSVISSLSTDGKDLLYVGTDGNGVHIVSVSQGKVIKSFRHETGNGSSIRSNSVYSLLVDRDGLMWIGFYQLGVDYTLYKSGLFTTYKYPPVFDTQDMPVRTIAFHGEEKLIGSRDGLYFINQGKKIFQSFHRLRANMIISSCYFEGKYYIGTYGGGMYVFNPETLELSDFDPNTRNPFLSGHIFCIRADAEGNLWIGTSAGLFRYRGGKQEAHYTSANSKLPEGNIYEIFFDSSRKGWICTEKGLCIWDASSESIKSDVFPEGFIHKEKVRVVYEDSRHNLYFLPEKGTLFVSDLSMSRFNRYSHALLQDKALMSIIEDNEGWLWLTTNNGIYRYDKKDVVMPYNLTDGILSPIFINCFPVKDEQGVLWFGNSKGLVYLDIRQIKALQKPPYKLAISDVWVNGKPVVSEVWNTGRPDEVRLDEAQTSLTIQFSALNYTAPSNMFYEYKLDGAEDDWKPLIGKSFVSFYNLPSGDYTFRVRSIGLSDTETVLALQIGSPMGAWLYAVLCLGILIVGGGTSFHLWRKRKLRSLPIAVQPVLEHVVPDADNREVLQSIMDGSLGAEMPLFADEEEETKEEKEKYKASKVSTEECRRIQKMLEDAMRKAKPYRNPDLKIADLATLTGVTSHALSYFFNQYLKKSYYDYINEYRVEEFKRLVVDEQYAKYTLEALAEVCGFSSRASFFRSFKKVAGITPNEYIKQLSR